MISVSWSEKVVTEKKCGEKAFNKTGQLSVSIFMRMPWKKKQTDKAIFQQIKLTNKVGFFLFTTNLLRYLEGTARWRYCLYSEAIYTRELLVLQASVFRELVCTSWVHFTLNTKQKFPISTMNLSFSQLLWKSVFCFQN